MARKIAPWLSFALLIKHCRSPIQGNEGSRPEYAERLPFKISV